jgi:hypothetical protein
MEVQPILRPHGKASNPDRERLRPRTCSTVSFWPNRDQPTSPSSTVAAHQGGSKRALESLEAAVPRPRQSDVPGASAGRVRSLARSPTGAKTRSGYRRVQPSTLCMGARRPLGSVCPLNARQGRHATKVRARSAHDHLLATAEISTNASLGNRATCTVARAGGLSLK